MTKKLHGRFTRQITFPAPPDPPPPDPDPVDPEPTGILRTATQFVYTKGRGAPLRDDGKWPDWGKHELEAGFTATYDFKKGARPGAEGPPWPTTFDGSSGWDHHNAWFEAIPALGGMPAAHRNCRFQVSPPIVHHYDPTSKVWTLKKGASSFTNMNGGYWNGTGTYTKVIDWPSTTPNSYWREEAVGWSVDLNPTVNSDGSVRAGQCIAHGFWPSAFATRQLISGDDHYSICSWVRVISDSASVDVNQSKYLGHVSGDVFLNSTGSNTLPDGRVVNPALVQNRMLRLTSQWKPTGIISGDEATIREIVKTHPFLNEAPPPA